MYEIVKLFFLIFHLSFFLLVQLRQISSLTSLSCLRILILSTNELTGLLCGLTCLCWILLFFEISYNRYNWNESTLTEVFLFPSVYIFIVYLIIPLFFSPITVFFCLEYRVSEVSAQPGDANKFFHSLCHVLRARAGAAYHVCTVQEGADEFQQGIKKNNMHSCIPSRCWLYSADQKKN